MQKNIAIYHMAIDPKRKSCINLQLDILKHYAKEHDWNVVKIYYDNSNLESEKKELDRLIQDSANNEFDLVLIKTGYYISRRTSQFLKIRQKLKNNDVTLYSLVEGEI